MENSLWKNWRDMVWLSRPYRVFDKFYLVYFWILGLKYSYLERSMNEEKCPESGELRGRKDLSNDLQRVVIWIRIFGKMRNGAKYPKMGQIKIVEHSFWKIWRHVICLNRPFTSNLLQTVFHKFHLVHSWMLCFKYVIQEVE